MISRGARAELLRGERDTRDPGVKDRTDCAGEGVTSPRARLALISLIAKSKRSLAVMDPSGPMTAAGSKSTGVMAPTCGDSSPI